SCPWPEAARHLETLLLMNSGSSYVDFEQNKCLNEKHNCFPPDIINLSVLTAWLKINELTGVSIALIRYEYIQGSNLFLYFFLNRWHFMSHS
ncbi:hypothetical protein, partial [Pseudomonas syringae]|uniref:hypothetical protein n=1 Tax=Pseudomonas syringae TaxID=317 RepID=UPI0034D76C2A